MLSLNLRQVRILDHLFKHEISHIDDLLAFAKISSRTLQSEIAAINITLLNNGYTFAINSNRNRGYSIEPSADNHDSYDLVKAQCKAYLDSEITRTYGDNARISYIIRAFLTTSDFIKSEDLVDELNISLATLTNDMRICRSIFEKYNIVLQSTPYYGMKIIGDPFAIRSCLLDFCDLYDIYAHTFVLEQGAIAQYNLDIAKMKDMRMTLMRCLKKHHIHLHERGFRRILCYLLILQGGYDVFPMEGVEVEEADLVMPCVRDLMQLFSIEAQGEASFLSVLLLASQDFLTSTEMQNSVQGEHMETLLKQIRQTLIEEINLDLQRQPHILERLSAFLFNFIMRKKYHIYEYNMSMSIRDIVRDLPVSCSLSDMILQILCGNMNVEYDTCSSLTLSLVLFNEIFIVPNQYMPVRVAFIGPEYRDSNLSVEYRMEMVSRYNVSLEHYSYYEYDDIDWSKYDCAFLIASPGLQLSDCPIDMFKLDYYVKDYQRQDFFQRVLARHRVENFLLYKTDNKVHVTIANNNHQYIAEMMEVLQGYGYTSAYGQQVMENLIQDNIDYYQFDPFVICLMWHKELEHTLFIFELATPEEIGGCTMYTIEVVIMNPNNNILAVKQADSYVRRMQQRAVL